ncbi:MAG: toll/interleukin-1 receptor domain-containing protein [Candidatus Melainabacteria bacterium]|nr:toll/interleukin-1 receptor domain-containing protein [Candidatus Melainabacteria bacterium]
MFYEYDVFICHASEDKAEVVEPLGQELLRLGLKVWLDKFVLKIGDSLRRKIDEGLSKSRYGIVVLSPEFFKKSWTQYELDGLFAREMADAVKVVLPVWHNLSAKDVRAVSPSLSILLAGNTANGIPHLAAELADVIGVGDNSIAVPEMEDDLSLAKRIILTEALKAENKIAKLDVKVNVGKRIAIAGNSFDGSEKQRQLFLFALEELMKAGLAAHAEGVIYAVTYPGIQAAERMEPVPKDKILEVGMK